MCSSDIFLGLLAILFPPIAVWVKTGICSADSLINILLCMLGFIPGLLHAWYIIAKYPDPESYSAIPQDAESHHSHHGGGTTYIIVQGPDGQQQRIAKANVKGYGTVPQPNVHQGQNGSWGVGGQVGGVVTGNGSGNGGQGSSRQPAGEGESAGAVPPTYAEAVKGDHKVQNHD